MEVGALALPRIASSRPGTPAGSEEEGRVGPLWR